MIFTKVQYQHVAQLFFYSINSLTCFSLTCWASPGSLLLHM